MLEARKAQLMASIRQKTWFFSRLRNSPFPSHGTKPGLSSVRPWLQGFPKTISGLLNIHNSGIIALLLVIITVD